MYYSFANDDTDMTLTCSGYRDRMREPAWAAKIVEVNSMVDGKGRAAIVAAMGNAAVTSGDAHFRQVFFDSLMFLKTTAVIR